MNRPSCLWCGRWAGTLATAGLLVSGSGCQLTVNPFTDELASQQAVCTPSVEGARAAVGTPSTLQRPYAPGQLSAREGTVTHGPLYFEDTLGDSGGADSTFAWGADDYLAMVFEPGRFFVDCALVPVSAVVTPPWLVMASDGRPSRQVLWMEHDATRWTPSTKQSTAPDPASEPKSESRD